MTPSGTEPSGASTPRWWSLRSQREQKCCGAENSSAPNHAEQVRVFRWAETLGTSWPRKKDPPALPQGRESLVHSKTWKEASRAVSQTKDLKPVGKAQDPGHQDWNHRSVRSAKQLGLLRATVQVWRTRWTASQLPGHVRQQRGHEPCDGVMWCELF